MRHGQRFDPKAENSIWKSKATRASLRLRGSRGRAVDGTEIDDGALAWLALLRDAAWNK